MPRESVIVNRDTYMPFRFSKCPLYANKGSLDDLSILNVNIYEMVRGFGTTDIWILGQVRRIKPGWYLPNLIDSARRLNLKPCCSTIYLTRWREDPWSALHSSMEEAVRYLETKAVADQTYSDGFPLLSANSQYRRR